MVKLEDFDILSPQKVRHRQTGATVSTYRYPDHRNAGSCATVNQGQAGEGDNPTFNEILPLALTILRREAMREAGLTL